MPSALPTRPMDELNPVLRSHKPHHFMKVVCGSPPQQLAAPDKIYKLHLEEGRYWLERRGRHNPVLGPEFKRFVFVIRADEPSVVYCGIDAFMQPGPAAVAGHTSIANQQAVLYAGLIHIVDGTLVSWNNGSGHYAPDEKYHISNLHPYVRRMLPTAKFRLGF